MEVDARDAMVLGVLPWCHALANRYVENRQDREDAVQSLALRLLKGANSFDPSKGKPSTWTAAIAIRLFRRPGRRTPEPATVQLPARLVDDRQRPAEADLDDAEQRVRVATVMRQLDTEDREILERHVLDKIPLAAIDRSVSRERQRQRYQRALRNARRLLESPVPIPSESAA